MRPKPPGLERVVRRVAELDDVARGGGRADRVLLLVARDLGREDPAGAENPVVAQGIVLAAERLLAEVGQRLAVELVVVVVDRSGVVARILEEGADERLSGGDVEGQLGGREVAVAGRIDDVAGRRTGRQDGARRVRDPVVGAEEPEPILDDVAAEVDAEVLALVAVDGAGGGDDRVGARLQRVVVEVGEDVALELVAARLGDDVDHAAGRAAVLGLVAAGLDVDRLHELEVELLALEAVLDAGGVDAVDDERVLGAGGAVDRDRRLRAVVRIGVRDDAGHQLRHRAVVAAGGQRVDRPLVEVDPELGRAQIDHRRVAHDGDLLGLRRTQGGVHRRVAIEPDRRLLLLGTEAGELKGEDVVARRQERQPVVAVRVGGGDARALEHRALDLHGHSRQAAAVLVGDPADNAAGRLRGERRERRDQRDEQEQRCGKAEKSLCTHSNPLVQKHP